MRDTNNSTHTHTHARTRSTLFTRCEAVRPIHLSWPTLFWPNVHDVMKYPRSDWFAGEVSHGRRGRVATAWL